MATIGDGDFRDTTPAPQPKRVRELVIEMDWPQGQTFAQALQAEFPAAVKNKTLPFSAKVSITIRVQEI